MRRLLGALLLVSGAAGAQTPRVGVDKRAELLAIMFRLAGAPEFRQGRVEPYVHDVDAFFAQYAQHAAIRMIGDLRRRDGVGFDAVMSLAIHITDATTFRERVPLDSPGIALDARWHGVAVRPFLAAAREFARDAHVERFFAAHQALYDTTEARLRRLVQQDAKMPWFARFFGQPPGAAFIVVPLLVNGGGNFGPHFDGPAVHEMYAFVGVNETDPAGRPVFHENVIPTLVHEFSHSFVNHIVDAHAAELRPAAESVYSAVSAGMRSQAYGTWLAMVDESVVRATVVRYLLANVGQKAAENEAEAEQAYGFVWIDELSHLLGEYEGQRRRYPMLESFIPRVVQYFDSLAPRIGAMLADYDAHRPSIVSTSVPNGADDVDPSLTTITVHFGEPMAPGYSINHAYDTDAEVPEIDQVGFDAALETFSLRVRLAPGHRYALRFSGPGFRSATGFPLKDFVLAFRTAGGP